jgi:hypothetical protein
MSRVGIKRQAANNNRPEHLWPRLALSFWRKLFRGQECTGLSEQLDDAVRTSASFLSDNAKIAIKQQRERAGG